MKKKLVRRARPLLGTIVEISLLADAEVTAQAAIDGAFCEAGRLEKMLSYFSPDSDLSRLNQRAHRQAQTVQPEILELLNLALELNRESGGDFNINCGAELERFGFLPGSSAAYAERSSGKKLSELVQIDGAQVRFSEKLKLDLGGIAKGFIVDRLFACLASFEFQQVLVNAGGDLRLRSRRGVWVGIRHPDDPQTIAFKTRMRQGALATSAGYFSSSRRGLRAWLPFVNRFGRCVSASRKSVSVLAPTCVLADALTKVVWFQGDSAGWLLEKYNARAIVLDGSRLEQAPQAAELAERAFDAESSYA